MCTHFVFSQWEEMRAAIKVFSHQFQNKTAATNERTGIFLYTFLFIVFHSLRKSTLNLLTVATYPMERVLPETPQTAIFTLFVHSIARPVYDLSIIPLLTFVPCYYDIIASLHYVMQQTQHWTEHFQLSVYYVRNFEIC